MKILTRFAVATVLGLAIHTLSSTTALAQGRPGGGQRPADGQRPQGGPPDSATATAHLTGVYAAIAPYDTNHDGSLDDTEKAAVANAVADGSLETPAPRGPRGDARPPAEPIVGRIAMTYASVAAYDANHDGTLDATEQAALKTAIEAGKIGRPGGPGGPGQRPPGVGGPRR